MKKTKYRKYEKWIGYCFYNPTTQHEVVLQDIWEFEDGRNCYQLFEKEDDGTYREYYCDYTMFKEIWNATSRPKN